MKKLIDKFTCWEAGFLRRWHANPDMCECGDTVSSHSHRMSVLACYLFYPSKELLAYIAMHDLGEVGSGDIAYPFKKSHPECYELLEGFGDKTVAEMGLVTPELSSLDKDQLWLLDRLDAHLVMLRYAPHLNKQKGWEVGREAIVRKASELGVSSEVISLMEKVEHGRS